MWGRVSLGKNSTWVRVDGTDFMSRKSELVPLRRIEGQGTKEADKKTKKKKRKGTDKTEKT
jgi:hypothetical protein